jgi:hypothetical protein
MEVPGSGSVKIFTDLNPDSRGPKTDGFFGSGSGSKHCAPYIKTAVLLETNALFCKSMLVHHNPSIIC